MTTRTRRQFSAKFKAQLKNELSTLEHVLTRNIDWDLIREQYDQMIKYTTALRLGIAETEAIMKRFTRNNVQHPTYRALQELGKVVKTIFLCDYLMSEELRIEINEGLNVVENWNSANGFIFYGKRLPIKIANKSYFAAQSSFASTTPKSATPSEISNPRFIFVESVQPVPRPEKVGFWQH